MKLNLSRVIRGLLLLVAGLSAAGQDLASEARSVTFSKDVAPILYDHCSSCHQADAGAPFKLTSYRDAKRRARQIREVVEDRFMPPWHAEKTDFPFANDPTLTDDEIKLIQAWVEQGAVEGNLEDLPAMPVASRGWELGEPDLVLTMDRAYRVPAEGPDIYRYFGFELNLPEDRWVRAMQYLPGEREVAHHALVFATDSKEWRDLDAAEEAVGFEKWQDQGRSSRRVLSWALGMNARVFPEGIGLVLKKGQDLVLQSHFHPSGAVADEVSSIGIYFADSPAKRETVEIQIPQNFGSLSGIEIPAGVSDYTLRESYTVPVDVQAHATLPHAHYIGKTFELNAYFPDGRRRDLLRIDEWNFAWQLLYRFRDPLLIPAGTRLETVITWDNTAENPYNPYSPPQQIDWGPYSEDEMGSIILDVVAVNDGDEGKLRRSLRDYRNRTIENLFVSQDGALAQGLEAVQRNHRRIAERVLRLHDQNGDLRLDANELEQARKHYRDQGFDGGLQRQVARPELQARVD